MSEVAGSGFGTFTGTERFEVLGQLGAGSMCVVYEARDRKHGDIVALKTLRHLDSHSLYRLKQEFRALSHFDHPNLVGFSELVFSEQGWFVTMERVQGVDFLTFCRGAEDRANSHTSAGSSTWATQSDLPPDFPREGGAKPVAVQRGLPDMVRLRSSMRQLAEGVQTLHAAGRVHRDLKPSNVLVTEAGRVVILDFGLVAEIDQDYTEGTLHQNIAGSAAYMSPEQSVGRPLAESSDWYSVGVMLYEALTGVWPYTGHLYQILTMKQEEDPPTPSSLVKNVPPELEALTMGLLDRDPEKRPTGSDVLAVFRSSHAPALTSRTVRPRFRYRNPELSQMMSAFQAVKQGRAVTLIVRGVQGVGKTSLVREFIKGVKRRDDVMILKGHCFEWETVPFKAIDGLMDNLSRALRRLDHREVSKLANGGLPYLSHMFPVLDRVDALQLTAPADLKRLTPTVIQQRAFEGLLQLIVDLANLTPVLIFLDDVQWGDADSAGVLAEIMRFAKNSPLLVVLATRTETPSVFLPRFAGPVQKAGLSMAAIDVSPLTDDQVGAMGMEMLDCPAHDPRIEQVVAQSGGIPSLILEVARQLEFQGQRAAAVEEELNEVTVRAIQALPNNARHLLNVLAVCEHPLPDEVALHAANLKGDAFEAVSTLRAHNLAKVSGARSGDTFEIVSEKVRDHVIAGMPENWRATYHERIAVTMEAGGGFPAEQLVHHYAGAQQHQKAGLVAWLASADAVKRNDMRGAVSLLERALEFGRWSPQEERTILVRLAESLAAVGDGKRAATYLERAAKDATVVRQRELRLRAAEEFLGVGDSAAGSALLDGLSTELGVTVASGKGWFGGGLQRMRRMRLRWRGLDFTSTAENKVPIDDLLRIDILYTRAMGMGLFDATRGTTAQTAHLELALEHGEPERALRALACEIRFLAWARDSEWRERFEHVLGQAKQLGSRPALARSTAASAIANLLEGDWDTAHDHGESAQQMLLHNRVGAAWERFLCRWVMGMASVRSGDLATARQEAWSLTRDLEQVDNALFQVRVASTLLTDICMIDGDVADVRRRLVGTPPSLVAEVGIPFLQLLRGWVHVELYEGRSGDAWKYLDERWAVAMAGLNAAPPDLRAELHLTRARAGLALAARSRDVAWIRVARASLTEARNGALPWVMPWCDALEGCAAALEGAPVSPAPIIDAFLTTKQPLPAALLRGLEDPWLADHGVSDPTRLRDVLLPGWRTSG